MVKRYFRYFRLLFITAALLGAVYAGLWWKSSYTAAAPERTNREGVTDKRVFDYGEVLTEDEEERLSALIEKRQGQTGCDIVLVTLNQSLKEFAKESEEFLPAEEYVRVYAETFYRQNKLGYDQVNGDGVILVDNWYREDTGKVYSWIATSGRAKSRIYGERLDRVFDAVYRYVERDPYKAYEEYVNTFTKNMRGGTDVTMPGWLPPAAAVLAALVFISVHIGKRRGQKTTMAVTYVNGGRPVIHKKEDIFINKVVTSRRIQRSDSGSGGGGRGGGGGSFGGGGRSR